MRDGGALNCSVNGSIVTMDSIEGCPCMICVDIDKCFESGVRDPVSCLDLTSWLTPRKAD